MSNSHASAWRDGNQRNGKNGEATRFKLSEQFAGKKLVIVGGTGFLGKVFWSLLLSRYPEISRLYVMIRPKGGQTAEERFEREIAPSEALRPLRDQYGDNYDLFLKDKVSVVAGDIVEPYCGFEPALRDQLRGDIDAVINASGIVDFDPPLDIALEVNAFGVQNLIALARDLGDCPVLHTSTCFVAGNRTGFIEETNPLSHPFPRAGELERAHWDPDREIEECMDVIEQAKHRAGDAFRQSRFLNEAKHNLLERHEPARGATLEVEIARVRRKYVEARLAEMGRERSNFWGWANTYTYTKSIGEQIVAASGLHYTIARPAIIESSVSYPFAGWNEGINTSAPLIYSLREGQPQLPGSHHKLDIIPCDMVASGMVISLGELLEGTAPEVYQYGSSDSNPVTMARIFELTGLYKRKYYRRTGRGGVLGSFLQAHFEGAMLSREAFDRYGPKTLAKGAELLGGLLKSSGQGAVKPIVTPTVEALSKFASQQRKLGGVLDQFAPFTAEFDYTFRSDHIRAAYARLSPEDKQRLVWAPESIEWRSWFLDVHMPGLEKWVFPELEKRIRRPLRAPERHQTLSALLDEMADRYGLAVALQRTEADGLSRISFSEWRDRSRELAGRLKALGVAPGDRVVLAGSNHPAWPIAFFGILFSGATVVPLDASIDAQAAKVLVAASRAKVFIADDKLTAEVRPALEGGIEWLALAPIAGGDRNAEPAEIHPAESSDVAALIYTSGTTGTPKGVMLSHQNLSALVAALAPLFPLTRGDRVLSVLPLHHTFELTCGMLLPLSRGARIVYIDELTSERLEHALKAGRITALVGVPALWEMLERKLTLRVAEHGKLASRVFDFAVELNRNLGESVGLDAGKLLFGPVHAAFGGHLRYLVSGGAALNADTHKLFSGLGLHLAEGYGLTEAAPVLTVARSGPKAKAGHVGKPIPGVEIRIAEPNQDGVGEVLARGPNVMLGYADDAAATRQVIDDDGWLHTGDLGKLDSKGNLLITGRAKDTIVASNGENVYPDDVEARLGHIQGVEELAVVGVDDGRGGERVACVAVPEKLDSAAREVRHARAKRALERAYVDLPPVMRPAVTTLVDAPLPRTSTRKVQRPKLRELVQRTAVQPRSSDQPEDSVARIVRTSVATIARMKPSQIQQAHTLRGDLGFDSLMLLELLVALESQLGRTLDAERVGNCETIADVETQVRQQYTNRIADKRASESDAVETTESELNLPEPLREAAMAWLGRAQMGFYDRVMQTKVSGRAFIPQNRNVIIAANHASHLDMGLVKYALGPYGRRMVSLAAQDYFFESGKWRKAYFDNLTNLAPLARSGSLRQALRQAGELIDAGNVVLLFPEGTRSVDGQIGEFKPLIGHLALQHRVDILPVWLGGTHAALPKGASVPRRRDLKVRIGPPLEYEELRKLTEGMSSADASRTVTRATQLAVSELSRGRVLYPKELDRAALLGKPQPASLADVFGELRERFVVGSVNEPVSYYFSLGKERWSMRISPEECSVTPGKTLDVADCVLKTSPEMFMRIVREQYSPSPSEFISGAVKSNNISLLMTFQQVFQLLNGSPGSAPGGDDSARLGDSGVQERNTSA